MILLWCSWNFLLLCLQRLLFSLKETQAGPPALFASADISEAVGLCSTTGLGDHLGQMLSLMDALFQTLQLFQTASMSWREYMEIFEHQTNSLMV